MNPFDRLNVLVEGDQLTARPIKFEYDKHGNATKALEFETTCPKCGGMVLFKHDRKEGDEAIPVFCEACSGVVNELAEGASFQAPGEPINVIAEGQENKVEVPVKEEECVFKDVVESGEFDPLYLGV
jgi:hypothetical protein